MQETDALTVLAVGLARRTNFFDYPALWSLLTTDVMLIMALCLMSVFVLMFEPNFS